MSLSPGREWWWTGDAWVAATEHPDGRVALGLVPAPAPAPPPVVTPSDPPVGARIEVPLTLLAGTAPVLPAAPVVVPAPPAARESGRNLRLAFTAGLAVTVSAGAWLLLHDGTRPAQASEGSGVDRREFAVRAAVDAQESYHAAHGTYAGARGMRDAGFYGVATVTTTVLHADRARYCLQVSSTAGAQWYDSRTQQLGSSRCR